MPAANIPNRYRMYVDWSEEDQLYVGRCPDLFYGGVCDAPDRLEAYAQLVQIVEEDLAERAAKGETAPQPRPWPGEAPEKPLFWCPKEREAWKITVAAFHALEPYLEPEPHHELLDGTVYVLPIPSNRHSIVLGRLYRIFYGWEGEEGSRPGLFTWPGSIILSPYSEPWPDFCLLSRAPDRGPDNPGAGDVNLVIEVAHPTIDFETGPKRAAYQQAAIPEYWVVDVEGRRVLRHLLPEYAPEAFAAGSLSPKAYPDVAVDVDALFRARNP
jgi:Uma2 family endonuclease